MPFVDIKSGIIITRDSRYLKLVEILPINFDLKGISEQIGIIMNFAAYLKVAPDNIKIIVKTYRADIDEYCDNMERYYNEETNENCKAMIYENAELVNYLATHESYSRRFFMAFEYGNTNRKISFEEIAADLNNIESTAFNYLASCGLQCVFHQDEDKFLLETLYTITNKRDIRELENKTSQIVLSDKYAVLPELLAPDVIDTSNKSYIKVNDTYHSYVYITGDGYNTRVGPAWLSRLIEAGDGISIIFTLRRQNRDKIISKITSHTMINRSRMKDVDELRADFDNLDSAIDSGIYLKSEMNRNNEDFYYMCTLIEITSKDDKELEKKVSDMKTLCSSMDITAHSTDYMNEQAYLSSLPTMYTNSRLYQKSKRNILTTSAAAAFPFSSYELCDQSGVFVGINMINKSPVIIDFFDADKYINANISVRGVTGAGKTMLIQALALRMRMQQIRTFIVTPVKSHEYREACDNIAGNFVRFAPGSPDNFNIMEIRKTAKLNDYKAGVSKRKESVLSEKISWLLVWFSLACPDLTNEETQYLDMAIIDAYNDFGITFDNDSLFDKVGFPNKFPTLTYLKEKLSNNPNLQKVNIALTHWVSGSSSNLSRTTNVDFKNGYNVIDISDNSSKDLPAYMFAAMGIIEDEAKSSLLERVSIICDELWEIIGTTGNELAAELIVRIFKTIRAFSGQGIAATQDLSEKLGDGEDKHGNAILHACHFKIILRVEEEEAKRMQEYFNLSDAETLQITNLQQGQGLFCVGNNRILVDFRVTQSEYNMITTKRKDLFNRLEV